MKKLFTLIAISLFGVSAVCAQNLQWEGTVGMNSSNWGDLGSKIGFHLGVRAELALPSLTEGIYTNAGLLFTQKGCKQDYGDLGSATTNAYYLELPIHIGYKYCVTDDFEVFGEAGPYLAYGLFGKSKVKAGSYGDDYDIEYDCTDDIDIFDMVKRFDVGVGLRVGVEFKQKIALSFGYDWGLLDSYERVEDEYIDLTPSMKHKNLIISVGYKF